MHNITNQLGRSEFPFALLRKISLDLGSQESRINVAPSDTKLQSSPISWFVINGHKLYHYFT